MQVTSRGAKGSLNSLMMSVNILNIYMEQKGLNILGLEFSVRELKRNWKVWIMLGNSYSNTFANDINFYFVSTCLNISVYYRRRKANLPDPKAHPISSWQYVQSYYWKIQVTSGETHRGKWGGTIALLISYVEKYSDSWWPLTKYKFWSCNA